LIEIASTMAAPASDCEGALCTFTPARVRWYLICWRLSEIVREPFTVVLASESRNSRDIDPWIRGGRVDPEKGRLIGLSLELARDRGGIALTPHSADRIASFLCAGPHLLEER
jgi:hypothetical protein